MASLALDTYNSWVDGLSVSPAQKTTLKTRAKQLYAAVAKETIMHLRHHANSVLNDPDATTQQKDRAQQVRDITDAVIAHAETDTWWLEVVGVT